jgi:hypothetical protein
LRSAVPAERVTAVMTTFVGEVLTELEP